MLTDLLDRKRAWSEHHHAEEPQYFTCLAALQAPEFFWIGCSDSRVPANVVAGLDPGEVFVHRNVATIVHSLDMNVLSALEFAEARRDRLAELNVIERVRRVCETPILQRAWRQGADLRADDLIHGLKDGRLRDLDCSIGPGHFQTDDSPTRDFRQETAQ